MIADNIEQELFLVRIDRTIHTHVSAYTTVYRIYLREPAWLINGSVRELALISYRLSTP